MAETKHTAAEARRSPGRAASGQTRVWQDLIHRRHEDPLLPEFFAAGDHCAVFVSSGPHNRGLPSVFNWHRTRESLGILRDLRGTGHAPSHSEESARDVARELYEKLDALSERLAVLENQSQQHIRALEERLAELEDLALFSETDGAEDIQPNPVFDCLDSPEVRKKYAGRYVAVRPEIGVVADAANLDDLYDQLIAKNVPKDVVIDRLPLD